VSRAGSRAAQSSAAALMLLAVLSTVWEAQEEGGGRKPAGASLFVSTTFIQERAVLLCRKTGKRWINSSERNRYQIISFVNKNVH